MVILRQGAYGPHKWPSRRVHNVICKMKNILQSFAKNLNSIGAFQRLTQFGDLLTFVQEVNFIYTKVGKVLPRTRL